MPAIPDQWSEQAIRALGSFTTLQTAARIFGISKATAYRLATTGEFPVPVIKVGTGWRVPVTGILAAAGVNATASGLDQSRESSADQHPAWATNPQPTHDRKRLGA
ncbi:helix-turn-helix domain-containing protein [Micromonospora sp. DT4]|uniref:helix-turn-helix domain-containing protein n=1 Tax=Micromonospora sp. DT4 TaxID=3393438 RepID=UPI003CFB26D2